MNLLLATFGPSKTAWLLVGAAVVIGMLGERLP